MPYRRLPKTDQARIRALKAAVESGDAAAVADAQMRLRAAKDEADKEIEEAVKAALSK